MTPHDAYRVLLLTSIPGAEAEIDAIAARHFRHRTTLFWEMGNQSTKADVLARIERADYNLIISHINGIILTPHLLQRATFGAVNIHPAPPEHGGCWGCWCQPVVNRSVRAHHGTTVHEIDEQIDHGPIYLAERWDVPADASIQSVFDRSIADCQRLLEWVCKSIAAETRGTSCFSRVDEAWHPTNRHTPIAEIRRWFAELDSRHPAHAERIFLNHPRAIMSPPYFDDL